MDILNRALRALGDALEDAGHTESLVAVGGVAMNLRGFASRSTADVDVLARRIGDSPPVLVTAEPLPGVVTAAIQRVARDFGLESDWMNTVVASQWLGGLPPGIAEDLEWHSYGALRVGVPGRASMIALKLFAAVDCGPRSVHMQDLLHLGPSDQDLELAASWVATQDASEIFHTALNEAVNYVRSHRR